MGSHLCYSITVISGWVARNIANADADDVPAVFLASLLKL